MKAGIRGLLAKHGIRLAVSDLESQAGTAQLDAVVLAGQFAVRLASQRRQLLMLTDEIGSVEVELDRALRKDPNYRALLKIRGIGPVLASVFVAEIGDVTRFPTADALACWAGITPASTLPTAPCATGMSAKKAAHWCAGPPLKRCNANANLRA